MKDRTIPQEPEYAFAAVLVSGAGRFDTEAQRLRG